MSIALHQVLIKHLQINFLLLLTQLRTILLKPQIFVYFSQMCCIGNVIGCMFLITATSLMQPW